MISFFQMRLDHPEVFWATGYQYRYYDNSSNLILLPEYLFDKNKIREHQKAMKARVEKLARAAKDLSEWEKEKYIHDFICENVTYDKLKKAYSHEIIGPLGHGVGVCEGIAKSVKVLCDALGTLVHDRYLREQSGERHQVPSYMEYHKNRWTVLSSGCHI